MDNGRHIQKLADVEVNILRQLLERALLRVQDLEAIWTDPHRLTRLITVGSHLLSYEFRYAKNAYALVVTALGAEDAATQPTMMSTVEECEIANAVHALGDELVRNPQSGRL